MFDENSLHYQLGLYLQIACSFCLKKKKGIQTTDRVMKTLFRAFPHSRKADIQDNL